MNVANKLITALGGDILNQVLGRHKKYRYRSAITGRFITKEAYDAIPKEATVREEIK